MRLDIGMSRAGLRKLANELLAACDGVGGVEVVRYAEPNGRGSVLLLTFTNDDMEDRADVTDDTAYWDEG